MTALELQSATLNDIVFESRNKQYGAYDLRLHYSRHTQRALWMGVSIFLMALLLPNLYDRLRPAEPPTEYMIEATLENLKTDLEEPPVVTPPPVEIPVRQPTVRYILPEVVADAPEEVPIATVEELKEANPGDKTQLGDPDAVEVIEAPAESSGPTAAEKVIEVEKPKEELFLIVEQQPEFPGGNAALLSFLQKNLRYPRAASNANISGKVYVQFVVNTDGSIQNAEVTKGIGFGCDEEALRVVQQMPRWKPGRQSGRAVRVKFTLPIVFALE